MRLIDADELEKILGNHWNIEDDQEFCNKTVWRCLREAPTVDAVEVVRCKDCVYSYPFDEEELKDLLRVGEWHCEFWYAEMHDDDYCSCGKRRKDGKID